MKIKTQELIIEEEQLQKILSRENKYLENEIQLLANFIFVIEITLKKLPNDEYLTTIKNACEERLSDIKKSFLIIAKSNAEILEKIKTLTNLKKNNYDTK